MCKIKSQSFFPHRNLIDLVAFIEKTIHYKFRDLFSVVRLFSSTHITYS